MITVVDLAETRDYDDLYKKTLDLISIGTDKLKENYLSLSPMDFLSFPAVIENDEIVCFSALQSDIIRWGEKIARCSTRMWIHPTKRFSGMTKFTEGSKFLNSYYCIPIQLEKARNLDYRCVFMSREENPRAFSKWANLVNKNCGTNFICLQERYNVCGKISIVPESCKQYVAVDLSTDESLTVWKTHMEKFSIQEDLITDSTLY